MWEKMILDYYKSNKGKALGMIIGLVFAISVLTLGFFKTLFLVICIILGYYIGKKVDNNESLIDIVEKIIPNGWK